VDAIGVSRTLADENTKVSERRINTTLAHEAGHGLLHAHLFVLSQQPRSLFGEGLDPDNERKILCRGIAGMQDQRSAYDGRWLEYQANFAIGGLLVPQRLLEIALEPYLISKGLLGGKTLDWDRKENAVRDIAEQFGVNPVVARIRIEAMFPASQECQMSL
jgi:hypothetical protein